MAITSTETKSAAEYSIGERFKGIISLLRFFKRANQLYMVDKFANATDSHTALEVIREMESMVLRLKPTSVKIDDEDVKNVCLSKEINEDEVELYRHLGARVGKSGGEWVYAVPCPKLPSEEELIDLKNAIDSHELKPSELAALALAKREKKRAR
ncbi:MAG: hypothetical protein ACP5NQ_04270 [Vulcanisaeta sp.]